MCVSTCMKCRRARERKVQSLFPENHPVYFQNYIRAQLITRGCTSYSKQILRWITVTVGERTGCCCCWNSPAKKHCKNRCIDSLNPENAVLCVKGVYGVWGKHIQHVVTAGALVTGEAVFGELLGGSLAEDTVALESGPGDLGVAIAVRDVHNHAVLGGVKLVASLGNQRLKISYIFLLCNQSTVTPSWDGKCRW